MVPVSHALQKCLPTAARFFNGGCILDFYAKPPALEVSTINSKVFVELTDKTTLFCVWACGPPICNACFKMTIEPWSVDSGKGAYTELTFCFINSHIFTVTRILSLGRKNGRKTVFILFSWSLLLACDNDGRSLFLLACEQAHRHNRNEAYPKWVANKT